MMQRIPISGPCPYCNKVFNDLEDHCASFHRLPYFSSNQPIQTQGPIQVQVQEKPKPKIDTAYCPTCGQKQKTQMWKEVLFGFIRYGFIAFWLGVSFGYFEAIQSIHAILGH